MNDDLFKVKLADVEEARARMLVIEATWKRDGFAAVEPTLLAKQEMAVRGLAQEHERQTKQLDALQGVLRLRQLEVERLSRSINAWKVWKSPAFGPAIGIFGGLLSLVLGFFFGALGSPGFGWLLALFTGCLAFLVLVLWNYSKEWTGERITRISCNLSAAERLLGEVMSQEKHTREQLAAIQEHWKLAHDTHQKMIYLAGVRQSYEEAHQEYQRLLSIVQSQQYRLIHLNWRDLRDVAFEDFLQQVFETLGYMVARTKKVGDQGTDLILSGKGQKIGIQAKGWSDPVGNGAVMAAYAGGGYYGCERWAVITNSDFTPHARDLASKLNCALIGGCEIPDLIAGKISL